MTWIAVGVGVVGIGMNLKGAKDAKKASKRQAARDLEAGEWQADQYEQKAIQEVAIGSRAAEQQDKEGRLVASSAKAIGAASGAGGYEDTISEIEAESDYRMLTDLYNSQQNARDLELAAIVSRREGADAARASREKGKSIRNQATGGALTDFATLYERYGLPYKPKPDPSISHPSSPFSASVFLDGRMA